MKIHDLTHPLRLGTGGFPGCAKIIGWPMREISWSHYNMLHISTDLHTGTHLDAMRHCMPEGMDAASLPLEHCVGPAVIADLRNEGGRGALFEKSDFLPYEAKIRETGKMLVKTGWSKTWETPGYHDQFPGFSREAAAWLTSLGIHLVGVEQASVHPTDHLEIHRIFFAAQTIIVEGLADLGSVPADRVEFFAVPWRIEEGDGSPRAGLLPLLTQKKSPMKGLRNKTAIVSGAANGLGEAITRRLVAEGCLVAGIDLQQPRQALREEFGGQVRFFSCDVADDSSLEDTVQSAVKALGNPSVLVNNAALFLCPGSA